MLIYRYETDEGTGPYQYEKFDNDHQLSMLHTGDPERPELNRDNLLDKVLSFHRCACPTLENILIWFKDWHEKLYEYGIKIREYEIDKKYIHLGLSKKQCIYLVTKAKLVRTLELEDYKYLF